jgi:hypothetical protein
LEKPTLNTKLTDQQAVVLRRKITEMKERNRPFNLWKDIKSPEIRELMLREGNLPPGKFSVAGKPKKVLTQENPLFGRLADFELKRDARVKYEIQKLKVSLSEFTLKKLSDIYY